MSSAHPAGNSSDGSVPGTETQVVSVLMPVYNEAATIETAVRRVLKQDKYVHELLVVDDGSTDGSGKILDRLAEGESRIQLLHHKKNRGKTAAIAKAIRHATGEILLVQDADLEYDPNEMGEVVGPILDGKADVVYGSRFLVRRATRVLYYYHYLANRFLTVLSNLLTNRNMTDIETCYKAFRAGVIKPLELTSSGFGLEVEITAMVCKTKARTYEVPISYYGRTYEEGKKINALDGLMALAYILYYNLIQPWTASGRAYIDEVNRYLSRSPQPHGNSEKNPTDDRQSEVRHVSS